MQKEYVGFFFLYLSKFFFLDEYNFSNYNFLAIRVFIYFTMKYILLPKKLRWECNIKYKSEFDVTSCFENGDCQRSGRREKSVLVHTGVIVRCCWDERISSGVSIEKQQTVPEPRTVIVLIFISLINRKQPLSSLCICPETNCALRRY